MIRYILISIWFFLFFLFLGTINVAAQEYAETVEISVLAPAESVDYAKKKQAIHTVLSESGSPLVAEVDIFIQVCKTHQIDCYLLPAIAGAESSYGWVILPGSYNPFGWGGYYYPSWSDAITSVGNGLKYYYIDVGLTTVEAIGTKYATSPTWAQKIHAFRAQFIAVEETL